MKRNSTILLLMLLVSIVSEINLIRAYILYEPYPEIITDKEVYFVSDIINLDISYFIYFNSNSDLDIKIFYSYSELNLSNATCLFDCPEIKSYFQMNYSLFALDIINSTTIIPCQFWFSLTATEYGITTILDATEITITKYQPNFKSQFPENVEYEFDSDLIINNSIIASQNESFTFQEESFKISIFYNSNQIYSSIIETDIWGGFQINILKSYFISLGTFQIQFLFNATDFFFNELLQLNLTIISKQLRLNFLNDTHIYLRPVNENFSIHFKVLDRDNNSCDISQSVFNIYSILNLTNITYNENFVLLFNYPINSGTYSIEISSNNPNYSFITNQVSLSFSLNNLTIKIQDIIKKDFDYLYFDILLSNFSNFDLINFSNFEIEMDINPEWIELNANIVKIEGSSLGIVVNWEDFDFLVYNLHHSFRCAFKGDRFFARNYSNVLEIEFPYLLKIDLILEHYEYNCSISLKCTIFDMLNNRTLNFSSFSITLAINSDFKNTWINTQEVFIYNFDDGFTLYLNNTFIEKFCKILKNPQYFNLTVELQNNTEYRVVSQNWIYIYLIKVFDLELNFSSIMLEQPLFILAKIQLENPDFEVDLNIIQANISYWNKDRWDILNFSERLISTYIREYIIDWDSIYIICNNQNSLNATFLFEIKSAQENLPITRVEINYPIKHFINLSIKNFSLTSDMVLFNLQLIDLGMQTFIQEQFHIDLYYLNKNENWQLFASNFTRSFNYYHKLIFTSIQFKFEFEAQSQIKIALLNNSHYFPLNSSAIYIEFDKVTLISVNELEILPNKISFILNPTNKFLNFSNVSSYFKAYKGVIQIYREKSNIFQYNLTYLQIKNQISCNFEELRLNPGEYINVDFYFYKQGVLIQIVNKIMIYKEGQGNRNYLLFFIGFPPIIGTISVILLKRRRINLKPIDISRIKL